MPKEGWIGTAGARNFKTTTRSCQSRLAHCGLSIKSAFDSPSGLYALRQPGIAVKRSCSSGTSNSQAVPSTTHQLKVPICKLGQLGTNAAIWTGAPRYSPRCTCVEGGSGEDTSALDSIHAPPTVSVNSHGGGIGFQIPRLRFGLGSGGALIFPGGGAQSSRLVRDPRTPELRASHPYRVPGPPATEVSFPRSKLETAPRPSAPNTPTYSFSTTWQAAINTLGPRRG